MVFKQKTNENNVLYLLKVADVMSKWDKYQAAGGTLSRQSKHHMFLFKKHLFLDEYIDIRDPVEKELLYYQVRTLSIKPHRAPEFDLIMFFFLPISISRRI